MSQCNLRQLTDDELEAALSRLVWQHNDLTAEVVAHIAEFDRRRLYAKRACPSTFAYCQERLHMSESKAGKYIRVARLAQMLPLVLELLSVGDVHLSALMVLAPHLDEANHQELLAAAKHMSKRQVEVLVAERFPRPDVPDRVRKLPAPRRSSSATPETATPAPAESDAPAHVFALTSPPPRPAKVVPLAPARFKIEFTADQALYDEIAKVKALLGPRGMGDLGELFFRAVRLLAEDLEKKKYGKTSRPRKAKRKAPEPESNETGSGKRSRHVPNEVKREVAERDQQQCTFVDADGNRCQERWGLELHHDEVPFTRGGPHTAANVTLVCRAHNRYLAEQEFGADFIEEKIAGARAFPGECNFSP